MINIPTQKRSRNGCLKKYSLTLVNKIFHKKKHVESSKFGEQSKRIMNPEEKLKPTVKVRNYEAVPRVPSTLSVSAVDMTVDSRPSPAASTLTLTPGRTRDIDQDMEALRLSRQDNPYLQVQIPPFPKVLASRESLVDSVEESESDDANLMSQEFPADLDVDPLTLPEIHEHMIRSPPPVTWPKSPNFKIFHFPLSSTEDISSQESLQCVEKKSPFRLLSPRQSRSSLPESVRGDMHSETLPRFVASRSQQRPLSDSNRGSKPFSLLSPEVCRLHSRSAEDNVKLVPKVEEYEQRRLEMECPIYGSKRVV